MEHDTLNRTDTHDLISSDKVDGTAVYNHAGDKLGTISHFMVGKRDGKVSYAVMSFGGFLGMATDQYALPWEKLDYDVGKGGYVVDITKEALANAPKYTRDQSDNYNRSYYEGVSSHYGSAVPTWY